LNSSVGEGELKLRLAQLRGEVEISLKEDLLTIQEFKTEGQVSLEQINDNSRKIERIEDELKSSQSLTKIELDKHLKSVEDRGVKIKESKENINKLQKETRKLSETLMDTLPMEKAKLRIFRNITGIEWATEASNDSVKGVITMKSQIKPFHFDKQQHSSVHIANALWELIDQDEW
jgi:phage host-nuclease inhibitor protein Gam